MAGAPSSSSLGKWDTYRGLGCAPAPSSAQSPTCALGSWKKIQIFSSARCNKSFQGGVSRDLAWLLSSGSEYIPQQIQGWPCSSCQFQMDGAGDSKSRDFPLPGKCSKRTEKRLQVSGPGCQKGAEVAGNPKPAENSACSGSNAEEEVEAEAEAEESPRGQVCVRLLGIHNGF